MECIVQGERDDIDSTTVPSFRLIAYTPGIKQGCGQLGCFPQCTVDCSQVASSLKYFQTGSGYSPGKVLRVLFMTVLSFWSLNIE